MIYILVTQRIRLTRETPTLQVILSLQQVKKERTDTLSRFSYGLSYDIDIRRDLAALSTAIQNLLRTVRNVY